MNYILDISVVAIICFFAWRCSKKGFVKAAVLFFGFVIAAIAARLISVPLSEGIYNGLIKDSVAASINETIGETAGNIGESIGSAVDALPGVIRNAAGFFLGGESAESIVSESISEKGLTLAQSIESDIVAPAVTALLQTVLFLVLFFILSFLIKRFAFIGGLFNKIPLVGKVNMFLGGILGTLEGIIIVFLAAVFIYFALLIVGGNFPVSAEDIDNSYLFKFFYNKNPLINIK